MQPFLIRLAHVLNRVSRVSLWLSGTCLVAMTIVVAYQVFGRYVLNATPSWAEALSITLMGWFVFLGAAVGVWERTHLGFDVLIYILPPGAKVVLRMISDLAILAFGVGMVFFGFELAVGTWDGTQPTLGIPDGASYIPIIVGGFLTCMFTLTRIVERLAGMKPDEEAFVRHAAGS